MKNKVILTIGQELNFRTFEEFREQYANFAKVNNSIIYLDFAATKNIDSTGISEIVKFNSQMEKKGNTTVLANICDPIYKVFKLVNLNRIFPIFKNIDYAYGCETELKNFRKHSEDLSITLMGEDRLLLELFLHILEAYGYHNCKIYENVETYLLENSTRDNAHILIVEKKFAQALDDSVIETIKTKTSNIIISDILEILDEKPLDSERFENEMNYIFGTIDEKSYGIIFNYGVKEISSDAKGKEVIEKYEEVKEFINEFLHDISSPLNVFLNTKSIFNDFENTEPELFRAFETSFNKIHQLIDEMKLFVDNEDYVSKEEIVMGDFLNEIITISDKLCEYEEKDFYFKLPENLSNMKLHSSYAFLNHLFINLISNAVKYSRKKVGIEVSEEDNSIVCRFFDDGDHLDSLVYFNTDGINYRSLKSTQSKGGGRGIKIIRKVINKLKFKIEIENIEKGKYIKLIMPAD